jgi:hypothetical protein
VGLVGFGAMVLTVFYMCTYDAARFVRNVESFISRVVVRL